MVAHEVRNALLPVQAALDSLYREVQLLPPAEVLSRRRPIIDAGLKGALRFTKELLQTAELGAKPPERFEPVQAVNEVIVELTESTSVRISPPAARSLPLLLGRREHFILAVRNLIENAIQHGGSKLKNVRVEMALDDSKAAVSLAIHDDGQGVAEADRLVFFKRGSPTNPGARASASHGFGTSLNKNFAGLLSVAARPSAAPILPSSFPLRYPASAHAERTQADESVCPHPTGG
jgi:signal transduction histidine kinase